MTWKPRTVPRDKSYLATRIIRAFRFQCVCARHPVDKSLAAVFGIPYDLVEEERRFFGEAQSRLRRINLALGDPDIQADTFEGYLVEQRGLEY